MQLRLRAFYLLYATHVKETISLSIPVIIAQLGLVMMGVIDNMMIGDLGYEYLSAASLANSVFIIIAVLGMGMTFAISPLVAEADAAQSPKKCGQYLRQGVWVGIITSFIISALIFVATSFLPDMGQPAQDVALGTSYLHILNISVFPLILFLMYKQFSDGLSFTQAAMYITMLGLGFNVLANWLLIYGNWGFPRLELDGAGYATLGSRLFMMILMIGYVSLAKRFATYEPKMRWRDIDFSTIRKIIKLGIPSGLQYFFEVGAFGGAVILIGWIGMEERSAHQIVINMASITYMVVSGIAAGTTIRVGNALGRKDFLQVKRAGLAGIYLGTVFMSITAIVFILLRDWLPTFYVDDVPVLLISAQLLIIGGFFQVFDGIQAVSLGILRGMQDVNIPTWITFIAYWIISLPLGYVLAFNFDMGVAGIWYSFVISLFIAAVALTYRFLSLSNKQIILEKQAKNDFPTENHADTIAAIP